MDRYIDSEGVDCIDRKFRVIMSDRDLLAESDSINLTENAYYNKTRRRRDDGGAEGTSINSDPTEKQNPH
jgi:hypothetical protein